MNEGQQQGIPDSWGEIPEGLLTEQEHAELLAAQSRAKRVVEVTGDLPADWGDMKFALDVIEGIDEGTVEPKG